MLNSFGEMCFLEESKKKIQENSNFEIFESNLYMKSGSMSLINASDTMEVQLNQGQHSAKVDPGHYKSMLLVCLLSKEGLLGEKTYLDHSII